MTRPRIRDLGIIIGSFPTGMHNAITDVPGLWVGHKTLIYDQPRIARTGLTVILPREGQIWRDNAFAAFHSFNGCGEMTGMHWLAESGLLCYPIVLTNTHHVGTVHEALVAYGVDNGLAPESSLAVVGETWDGWLNDMDAFHITREHVYEALAAAGPGPVAEGNVGGGTGMICHDFKGGIGTASRLVQIAGETYTLGVLVQANHGSREDLRVDGVPVGRLIGPDKVPLAWGDQPQPSSIIVIIATDAPLLPGQNARLARRAAIGFARVGGIGQLRPLVAPASSWPIRHHPNLRLLNNQQHVQPTAPKFQLTCELIVITNQIIYNIRTASRNLSALGALSCEEVSQPASASILPLFVQTMRVLQPTGFITR